jgi:hypothetical protein
VFDMSEGRMPKRTRLFAPAVLASLGLVALAVTALPRPATSAPDACVTAKPTSKPPEGSRWVARRDRANDRLCWLLADQKPAAAENAHATSTAKIRRIASRKPLPVPRPNVQADEPPVAEITTAAASQGMGFSMRFAGRPVPGRAVGDGPAPLTAADQELQEGPTSRPVLVITERVVPPAAKSSASAAPATTGFALASVTSAPATPAPTSNAASMLALLAGALGLAAVVGRGIFKLSTAPAAAPAPAQHAERPEPAQSPAFTRNAAPPGFERVARQGGERRPIDTSDPDLDIEATLQKILKGWERRAA